MDDLVSPPTHGARTDREGKGKSALDTAQEAERLYELMGFPEMPREFWTKSVFVRPSNGTVMDCHPSAFDFADGKDFRFVGLLFLHSFHGEGKFARFMKLGSSGDSETVPRSGASAAPV